MVLRSVIEGRWSERNSGKSCTKLIAVWKVWFTAIIPYLLVCRICCSKVGGRGVWTTLCTSLSSKRRALTCGAPYSHLLPDPVEVSICCKSEKLGLNQQVGTSCQFSASGAGSHESQEEEGVSLLHALPRFKHSKWSSPGCSINLCSTKELQAGKEYLLSSPSHLCGWRKLAKPDTFLSLF